MDAKVKDTTAIDGAIDTALAEKRIVGGVVLVMQDGAIAYRRAAGLADRERATPMREDAVFRLASLTKPLVTAAALRMAELGKIALADPVTRWLPAFRPALPNGEVPTITLRHLLTHTAGLSYRFMQPEGGPYERAGVSDGADEPGLSMADNLERIARAGLFYRPGEKWEYSVAMDVLGAVLQAAEGQDLEAIVAKYVTAPLGAPSLSFNLTDEQRARLVTPYADGKPEPVRIADEGLRVRFPDGFPIYAGLAGINLVPARVFDNNSFRSGGGGMNGSADDMLKFVEAIRTGGAPDRVARDRRHHDDGADRRPADRQSRPRLGVRLRRLDPHRSGRGAHPAIARHVRLGRRVGSHLVHRSGATRLGGIADQHRARRHDGALHPRPARRDLHGVELGRILINAQECWLSRGKTDALCCGAYAGPPQPLIALR